MVHGRRVHFVTETHQGMRLRMMRDRRPGPPFVVTTAREIERAILYWPSEIVGPSVAHTVDPRCLSSPTG